MASIRIMVCWSPDPDSEAILTLDDTDTVDQVIEQVMMRAGTQFPTHDDDDHRIVYRLYRALDDRDEALDRGAILNKLGMTQDEKLYFCKPGQTHWWRRIQVYFADGCVVPVPSEGLPINRGYLLRTLPFRIVAVERFKLYIGRDTPLRSVGRERHCEIVRQGEQWLLRAFGPTSIDGRLLENGESAPITSPAQVVLGREGWPIEIQMARL